MDTQKTINVLVISKFKIQLTIVMYHTTATTIWSQVREFPE